jgi:Na+/melibiose symporter-like transporter
MNKKLTQRSLASYGQLALPLAIADLPLVIYLTAFYGGDIGVPLGAMSWVLLATRLSDVVTDPMIGIFSDRSAHWTIGRRKAWVLLGIPVKMLAIYMVFFVEPGAGWPYMLLWLIVLYLGWTMISIPYGAWGAELSINYTERNRITGWRTLFGLGGTLVATMAPLITGGGAGTELGLTPVMQGLGLWALIMFPIAGFLLWRFVPEPPVRSVSSGTTWLRGIKIAASNTAFVRILLATTIGRIGGAINAAVVVFFFIFAMGLGPAAGIPVIIYLLSAVLGVPLWVAVGSRIAKHNALIIAVLSSIFAFAFLLAVPQGSLLVSCLVMAVAGLGGGAAGVLGSSIAADVIDLDELRSRQSRAGLLIAFWGMGGKFADALGGFIALQILAWVGFSAANGAANSPEAIASLTLTYILVPWPFYFVSILLLWRFPISGERQARIRRLIERRALRIQGPMAEPAE